MHDAHTSIACSLELWFCRHMQHVYFVTQPLIDMALIFVVSRVQIEYKLSVFKSIKLKSSGELARLEILTTAHSPRNDIYVSHLKALSLARATVLWRPTWVCIAFTPHPPLEPPYPQATNVPHHEDKRGKGSFSATLSSPLSSKPRLFHFPSADSILRTSICTGILLPSSVLQ